MNSPVHTLTVIPGRWRATIVAGAPAAASSPCTSSPAGVRRASTATREASAHASYEVTSKPVTREGGGTWIVASRGALARNSQDPADLTVGARGLRGHLESMRTVRSNLDRTAYIFRRRDVRAG
jgi:hypothetical protein